MHWQAEIDSRKRALRAHIAERKLRHDPKLHQIPLGCAGCRERKFCGGLAVEANLWNCLSLCCGNPSRCDRVCRNNPDFAFRVHEIGGFALELPRTKSVALPSLPPVVPEIYHASNRKRPFSPALASVSLYRMFDRRTGDPRYRTNDALCEQFKISKGTPFLLTGIQRDRPLERWWEMGKDKRQAVIYAAKECGVVLATSPNYSLFLDRPRWDDLHAMKRIALVHREFLEAGLPAALHVNGRTETDFDRWTKFILAHPEITHLSFEFTTGTGRPTRRPQYANWLCGIAKSVSRPLHLLVRGGSDLLPELCSAFADVTFLETTTFLKTMMRFRAIKNASVDWWVAPTAVGAPLDDLLETNWEICEAAISEVIRNHSKLIVPETAIA
jgi:hypothetical protein